MVDLRTKVATRPFTIMGLLVGLAVAVIVVWRSEDTRDKVETIERQVTTVVIGSCSSSDTVSQCRALLDRLLKYGTKEQLKQLDARRSQSQRVDKRRVERSVRRKPVSRPRSEAPQAPKAPTAPKAPSRTPSSSPAPSAPTPPSQPPAPAPIAPVKPPAEPTVKPPVVEIPSVPLPDPFRPTVDQTVTTVEDTANKVVADTPVLRKINVEAR